MSVTAQLIRRKLAVHPSTGRNAEKIGFRRDFNKIRWIFANESLAPACRLARMPMRFELVLEPSDHWTVWDNARDEPVVFAGRMLAGLSQLEATAACLVLNRVDRRRMEEEERAASGGTAEKESNVVEVGRPPTRPGRTA